MGEGPRGRTTTESPRPISVKQGRTQIVRLSLKLLERKRATVRVSPTGYAWSRGVRTDFVNVAFRNFCTDVVGFDACFEVLQYLCCRPPSLQALRVFRLTTHPDSLAAWGTGPWRQLCPNAAYLIKANQRVIESSTRLGIPQPPPAREIRPGSGSVCQSFGSVHAQHNAQPTANRS